MGTVTSDLDLDLDRDWWSEPADTVADGLASDANAGLTQVSADRRLEHFGSNELESEPGRPVWVLLLGQFANTLIVVLLVAALVTILIDEIVDAVVILVIVLLNAVIGFVQEYRADQAMDALKDMTAPSARVVRGGTQRTVDASSVVPGDLLVLDAGDIVAADVRLVEAPNLSIDEAALTGESVPVDKDVDTVGGTAGAMVADRHDMAFKGTSVVHGRGRGLVVATGMRTELGQVAGLLKSRRTPATPLQKRLAVLGRRLAVVSVAVCGVVFVSGLLRGEELSLMFLTAVSLAVAAIPEALPAVVTIALALGAQRLSRRHALVRRLPAVETLGSVTVICSDKTGTLTESRMVVERVRGAGGELLVSGSGFGPEGEITDVASGEPAAVDGMLGPLAEVAMLCNDAELVAPAGETERWGVVGDPTEGALLALGAKAGIDHVGLRQRWPRIGEVPFDSTRKRMATVHRKADGTLLVAAKGAVEAVLPVCAGRAVAEGTLPLSDESRSEVLREAERYALGGFRVLALARRTLRGSDAVEPDDPEVDLTFLGLVALADPPRPQSPGAVASCRDAGITPVMITGDSPATARAIGERLGIVEPDAQVLTGAELAAEGESGLADHVEHVAAYARTTPEQKLDIIEAWQSRGDVVAMTGDGVNDAPALRTADIGVSMGIAGTEVAKEASDMVLTDDDFATIVAAVGEGRRIYDNIRKFIRYTLTSNSGEIWVMLLGPFVGLTLPLLPVQILWINLLTDGLPGLALGVEPTEPDVMERPPRRPDESVFARGLWQHVAVVGLIMGLIPLALGIWAEATDRPWQTMVFTSLALLQLGHVLAVRSESQSFWRLGLLSNRPMLGAVLLTLSLQLLVIYLPLAQELLHTEALSAGELVLVLALSTAAFWAVEVEKAVRRRSRLSIGH